MQAVEIKISEEVRTLCGLSADNANVDKAVQKLWRRNNNYIEQSFTSSTTWTVPDGVQEIDMLMVGGGGGGGNGGVVQGRGCDYDGGNGGNSGNSIALSNVKVKPGDVITMTIGAGGQGASSEPFVGNPISPKRGSSGGDTYVAIGSVYTFAAYGGKGGEMSSSTQNTGTINPENTKSMSLIPATVQQGAVGARQNIPSYSSYVINSIGTSYIAQFSAGAAGGGADGYPPAYEPSPVQLPVGGGGAGGYNGADGGNATGLGSGGGGGSCVTPFVTPNRQSSARGGQGGNGWVYIRYYQAV